jgi:hypothetical protein
VHRRNNGAWVKLDDLKRAGNLIDVQPLHDKAAIENLLKRWRRLTFTTIAGQPFSELRDYFGEVRSTRPLKGGTRWQRAVVESIAHETRQDIDTCCV